MERNLLHPQAEIEQLFTKHFQNLMETYQIKNYLFVSDSRDGRTVIRGSPEQLSALFIRELESNSDLQKILIKVLRDTNIIGGEPK